MTNVDAVLARSVLAPVEAGAYAGAVTLGKIVLFAPIAVGFLLLERTSRAHARGEPTERALFLSLAFVLATSGIVALAYVVAPAFFVGIVVGDQYPTTAAVVPLYGAAALANALLNLWISYFVGRGEMRVGVLLAVGSYRGAYLHAQGEQKMQTEVMARKNCPADTLPSPKPPTTEKTHRRR